MAAFFALQGAGFLDECTFLLIGRNLEEQLDSVCVRYEHNFLSYRVNFLVQTLFYLMNSVIPIISEIV